MGAETPNEFEVGIPLTEGHVLVPPQTFHTPTNYVNHVQLLSMEGMAILEFRAILPDLSRTGVPRGEDLQVEIEATPGKIPPTARLMLPLHVAKSLHDMLTRSFEA